MYTDIRLKIKTDDYELLRIKTDLYDKGYVNMSKNRKGKNLLLVCTLLEDENELMMSKDGYFVIDTLDSIIREAPSVKRLSVTYPADCLLFVCDYDESDIKLEVKSDYVMIKQLKSRENNPSIVLPKAWEGQDVCVIPYNKLSADGDEFKVDTAEIIFRHTKKHENRSFSILSFRKRFENMMALILKIP